MLSWKLAQPCILLQDDVLNCCLKFLRNKNMFKNYSLLFRSSPIKGLVQK